MVDLKQRILEIAYKHKLSHLGSYLSAVDIIDEIYKEKKPEDIFILSSGHAALALYVVLEKYEDKDAEELFLKHGGHPHRDEENGIYCSTGSLGLGITIAVGRALANKTQDKKVYVNVNGYAAYDKVDERYLVDRLEAFLPSIHIRYTSVNQYPFLRGLNAHYHIMSEQDYESTLKT